MPRYHGGRGGVGNYTMRQSSAERAKREKAEVKEKAIRDVEERIRLDVEAGLSKPERAYVWGVRPAWEVGPVGAGTVGMG